MSKCWLACSRRCFIFLTNYLQFCAKLPFFIVDKFSWKKLRLRAYPAALFSSRFNFFQLWFCWLTERIKVFFLFLYIEMWKSSTLSWRFSLCCLWLLRWTCFLRIIGIFRWRSAWGVRVLFSDLLPLICDLLVLLTWFVIQCNLVHDVACLSMFYTVIALMWIDPDMADVLWSSFSALWLACPPLWLACSNLWLAL